LDRSIKEFCADVHGANRDLAIPHGHVCLNLKEISMSKVHEGWTAAHAHTPLSHTSADNAGLPTPRDQGESASHVDKEGHESKYHEAHKSREHKFHAAKSPEERDRLREEFAKEDEAKQPGATQGDRKWTAGTATPREHK
jgi:hypothetical protein